MLEVQTGFGNQGDIEIQALTQLALAVRRWLSNGEVGANQNRVSSSTAVLLLPGWVGLVQLPASEVARASHGARPGATACNEVVTWLS